MATAQQGYRPKALRTEKLGDIAAMEDRRAYLSRWLSVWVALSAVVVLVVVVYLIFISNSLASINSGLQVARNAVTGAGGHTQTLPRQIAGINTSLGGIDTALKPIRGDAGQIVNNLTSIENSLKATDGSLASTSPMLQTISSSLVDTSGLATNIAGNLNQTAPTLAQTSSTLGGITSTLGGVSSSLVNTSGVLVSVLGLAGRINGTLIAANVPAGNCNAPETNSTFFPPPGSTAPGGFGCDVAQLGVQNIHQRVSIANSVLAPAQVDLTNITAGLQSVNGHLTNICNSKLLQAAAKAGSATATCPT